jgi:predicted TIM-barrel fold metal-dependent hydrolase
MALVDTLLAMPDFDSAPQDPVFDHRFGSIAHRFGSLAASETVGELLAQMDQHDVELAVLGGSPMNPAVYRPGPFTVGLGFTDELFDMSCVDVAATVGEHPDRFRGFVFLDPSDCMAAIRRLERAVTQYGLTIAHVIPSVVGLPPNHPNYYPIYAKCVELGVTLRVNIGMPGPSHRAQLQEPILLDEVLLTFPDLTIVGAHVGNPWIDQVIALLRKYEHFYLMTSGWAPSRVPQAIWDFANTTRGADKIMWASDYPVLSISRTATEALDVPLKPDNKRRYLCDNAIAVHKL